MGVTGTTENKLFKVRTLNQNNPYQVGVNGVLDIFESEDGLTAVKYEIDDITYTSYLTQTSRSSIDDFTKVGFTSTKKKTYIDKNTTNFNSGLLRGTIQSERIPGSIENRYFIKDGKTETKYKILKPTPTTPSLPIGDTIYVTKKFSYDQFDEGNIYKKEKYVGLIEHPIVESDLFIERDEYTIFERHQRLSEINNLAELQNYRGGYFKNIKTL